MGKLASPKNLKKFHGYEQGSEFPNKGWMISQKLDAFRSFKIINKQKGGL